MADIDRIRGPSGPPPSGPKKEPKVDGHKFREVLDKKKVKAPEESDAEQQGKRKRRERSQAEQQADVGETLAVPPPSTPSAGEPSEEREFKVKETGAGAGVSRGSTGEAGAPTATPSEEAEPAEEPYPEGYVSETRPREKQKEAPPAEGVKPPPTPAIKKGVPISVPKHAMPKEKAIPVKAHEKAPAPQKEKKAGAFEAHRKQAEPKAPRVEDESPLPQGAWESTRSLEKKKEKEVEPESMAISGAAPVPVTGLPEIAMISTGPLPPYTQLPNPMPHLFDRMVGGLEVVYLNGSTETTITLNAKEFENSAFYGTQIVITESPNARREYNIQILTPKPEALKLLNKEENMGKIMTSFETGNYPFRVRRFETGILTEESHETPLRKPKKVTKSKKTKE